MTVAPPRQPANGRLRELTIDECLALLRQHKWGRIALPIDSWPAILPVNYAFDDVNIVFRTGEGAKLEESPMRTLAFEGDDAAPDGTWGWSVLAQGPAFDISNTLDETSQRLRALAVEPWAPGEKPYWIRVCALRITGRAFGAVPGFDPH